MDKIKQAKIEGYLLAFSLLHTRTIGYTFEFTELEYHDDILVSFINALKLDKGEEVIAKVTPIFDWKTELISLCDKWFFEIGYTFSRHDKPVKFFKEFSINGFIDLLSKFFDSDFKVYKVDSEPNFYAEIYWDDLIFVCNNKQFLLHFGNYD